MFSCPLTSSFQGHVRMSLPDCRLPPAAHAIWQKQPEALMGSRVRLERLDLEGDQHIPTLHKIQNARIWQYFAGVPGPLRLGTATLSEFRTHYRNTVEKSGMWHFVVRVTDPSLLNSLRGTSQQDSTAASSPSSSSSSSAQKRSVSSQSSSSSALPAPGTQSSSLSTASSIIASLPSSLLNRASQVPHDAWDRLHALTRTFMSSVSTLAASLPAADLASSNPPNVNPPEVDAAALAAVDPALDDSGIIGSYAIMDMSEMNRNAEIGHVWLTPRAMNSGINTEVIYVLLKYCMETMHTVNVVWKCDSWNTPSLKSALRHGAKFEGILRNDRVHVMDPSRMILRTTLILSWTDSDWVEVRPMLQRRLDILRDASRQQRGNTLLLPSNL